MAVYTKTGDKGISSLRQSVISGNRKNKMSKSAVVFDVLGTLDELSTVLGFLQLSKISEIRKNIISIQEDLLTIGAVISGNITYTKHKDYWIKKTEYFEKTIDSLTKVLTKLHSFILVGGSKESSYLHLARVVCRRLERLFVKYTNES